MVVVKTTLRTTTPRWHAAYSKIQYIFCLNSRDVGPPYHIYTFDHTGPLQIFQKIAVAKLANKHLVAYQGPLILK